MSQDSRIFRLIPRDFDNDSSFESDNVAFIEYRYYAFHQLSVVLMRSHLGVKSNKSSSHAENLVRTRDRILTHMCRLGNR